jgi:hypothetical protein
LGGKLLSVNKIANQSPQAAETHNDSLVAHFKAQLPWNLARLKCFVLLVQGVLEATTVSLCWLSQTGSSVVKSESKYRRFQRFFANFIFNQKDVGCLILSLLPKPQDGWVLAMDRTNWKFGKTHINILMVTVIVEGVGFPVAWLMLPVRTKRGNSNKHHRTKVMNRVLKIMDAADIRVLTMDREFIGKAWLKWLDTLDIPYIVRIKKDAQVGAVSAHHLCGYRRWKKQMKMRLNFCDQAVYFAAKKIANGRDPYLALVSNRFQGSEMLEIYKLRWGIETFFSHLKKRGFCFEDTHMTKAARIDKLVAVLGVAFTLCHRWGRIKEQREGKKIKKHGYRARSVFRIGLESLHKMLKRSLSYFNELKEFVLLVIARPLAQNFVV